MQERYCRM